MKHKFIAKRYWNKSSTPMAEVFQMAGKYDDIINLSLGDPDYITDVKITEAACQDAKDGHTRYTDSQGDPELRNAIIEYYKEHYDYKVLDKEVMVVVGACHGMYLVLETILDEGDEVIIPEPYFTPYNNQVLLAKGKPVFIETKEEENFQININNLKNAITDRTKAIIINSPNNPTGAFYTKETLENVAKIAKENDLLIIADDVYGAFSYGEPFYPITAIEDMKERTITIGSFSKDYAMTGWRIGYVLASEPIIDCIRDINEGVCFSAPSVSQRAAIHAIKMKKLVQPSMIEEYKNRVNYAYERINKIPNMSVLSPQGSFYLFVNIGKTGLSSIEVSKIILEKAHVLVLPGIAFGASGDSYIRLACTVGVDKLKEAFDRIENMELFNE